MHFEFYLFVKKLLNSSVISVISDLYGKGFVGMFYKKELQKTNQNQFRVETVIKKKM